MSQTDAYIGAGYKETPDCRKHASTLMTKQDIKERIGYLQDQGAKKAEVTVLGLTSDLLTYREDAWLNGMHRIAVDTTMRIAKLNGLLIDKQEMDDKRKPKNAQEELTEEERDILAAYDAQREKNQSKGMVQ